ncbi:MAG: orotidine-5'-phosphate decarboxylase [Clostridiales bacterium]|jgi:orotidine-5'-phosphate decarboxylase|nr:orotidine-5'-phosphate decarboxylase [Clostridiales bacterium]
MNRRVTQRGDVIVACDFENEERLDAVLAGLADQKPYLKIGMEMYYRCGAALVCRLKDAGYPIFLDLKLHDIPTTVGRAAAQIAALGVDMLNVHAGGGIDMMRAAAEAVRAVSPDTLVIAVTQLTSTSPQMLKEELLIDAPMADTVRHYAQNAKKAGLDGVVCSALEAPVMRELGLFSVTPGIRFPEGAADDQKRVVSPERARALGSGYIVMGRPITGADDPAAAYRRARQDFLGSA